MTHGGPYLYWNNRYNIWFLCLRFYHSNFCDNSYHHRIAHRVFIFSAKKLRNIALCILFIASDFFFSRFVRGEPVFSFARPSAYYSLLIHVNQYTHTYRVSLIKLANRILQQQQCGTYRVVQCIIHYTHPVQHLNRLAIKECIALCYIRIYHTLTLTCLRMYSPENWLTWSQERSPNILCLFCMGFRPFWAIHTYIPHARHIYNARMPMYFCIFICVNGVCCVWAGKSLALVVPLSKFFHSRTHCLPWQLFFSIQNIFHSLSLPLFFFSSNVSSIVAKIKKTFIRFSSFCTTAIESAKRSALTRRVYHRTRECACFVFIIVVGIETQTTMIHIHSSGSYEKNKNGGEMEK